MAILVKAGIPVLQALEILQKQVRSPLAAKVFKTLIADVENGQFLATSLNRFPGVFGEFAVNMIRLGELSGSLHQNFTYVAEELKKKQLLRHKILSAMVYPIFIVIATFGITALLILYIFPKILPIFKSLEFSLPWTTRSLIALSNFFIHSWVWVLSALPVLIIIALLLTRFQPTKFWLDRLALTIPVLGRLLRSYHMANLCRTLGLLLRSDVMIVEATLITASTTLNLVYQRELRAMAEKVTAGGKLSEHMQSRTKLFPAIFSQMVTVGETTGNLSETLRFLQEMYEQEVEELTKNLTTVIEPVLMVFMGLVVGFIAISIITPIYEITRRIHP